MSISSDEESTPENESSVAEEEHTAEASGATGQSAEKNREQRKNRSLKKALLAILAGLLVLALTYIIVLVFSDSDPEDTVTSTQEDTAAIETEESRSASPGSDAVRPGEPQGLQGSAEIGIPEPILPPVPIEPEHTTGSGEHIITTSRVDISVEYEDIRDAVRQAQDLVEQQDGHIQSRDENYSLESDTEVRSTITFRVPAENHEEVMDRMDELGEVKNITENADDVSDEVVELETRIENAESSLERLRDFIEDAETTEELLQVEEQINRRQADLEVMIGQRDGLIGESELSTLTVVFTADTPDDIEEPEPVEATTFNDNAFMDNLMRGWSGIVATVNFFFAAFGLLLPYTPIIAVIAAIIWFSLRKKKGKDDQSSASTASNEEATMTTETSDENNKI